MDKINSIIDKVVYLYIQTTITSKNKHFAIELIKVNGDNEISKKFFIDSSESNINNICKIAKIIKEDNIIVNDMEVIKNNHILGGIFNCSKLLDIKEFICILEPWRKNIDINNIISELTVFKLDKDDMNKANYLKIVCNALLCRQWQREESIKENERLYNKLVDLFDKEDGWIWCKHLLRPLIFTYDKYPYIIYEEKKTVKKVVRKIINYTSYEELLRNVELWNNDGNYQYRKDQEAISKKIRENINNEKRIFIEAPTGSGKTFAYLLIVAIKAYLNKCEKKRDNNSFIISTDTKELQNQLIEKDIPMILEKLKLQNKVSYGYMKGKGNYICIDRLNKNKDFLTNNQSKLAYVFLYRLSQEGQYGDIENINYWAYNHFEIEKFISKINCDSELCNLDKCRKKCYLKNRYNELSSEDITVVNHSLLASWPYGEKKKMQHLVLDEAHNLMEKAYDFFSEEFNSIDFFQLLKKLDNENPSILFLMDRLNGIYNYRVYIDKANIIKVRNDIEFDIVRILNEINNINDEESQYNLCEEFFNPEVKNKKIMEYLNEEFKSLNYSIYKLYKILFDYVEEIVIDEKENGNEFKSISNYILKLKGAYDIIDNFISFSKNYAKIIEVDKEYKYFIIKNTPLEVGEIINDTIFKEVKSVTFLSATLKVNNQFTEVKKILGQQSAETFSIEPVFKLKNRTRIFNVKGIGSYKDGDIFNENTAKFIFDVASLIGGHTLVLFNNNRRREEVYKCLQLLAKDSNVEIHTSKKAIPLLNHIDKNVIILGTKGFFEGIDVPGDALSCVMIDKIPNINPKDPLFKAFKQYKNIYYKGYNYPKVCIKMKQSYGRLIRSNIDYGYFIILDGGTNENTIKELEVDLMGPKIETKWSKDILNSIYYDYSRWKKENLKQLLEFENEEIKVDDFNTKSLKMRSFWKIENYNKNNEEIIFKNKKLSIKISRRINLKNTNY